MFRFFHTHTYSGLCRFGHAEPRIGSADRRLDFSLEL
jgi:hypothetical protein